jgi:hypothetical protein
MSPPPSGSTAEVVEPGTVVARAQDGTFVLAAHQEFGAT